jgi:hypothetical protein
MKKYQINIGDYSKDGHNQSDTFYIETSHSREEMVAAYNKFSKKNKITFKDRGFKKEDWICICAEYEDPDINQDVVDKLERAGVKFLDNVLYDKYDEIYSLEPESILQLLMEMIKVEIPDFTYEIVGGEYEYIPEFAGFGYGVYS